MERETISKIFNKSMQNWQFVNVFMLYFVIKRYTTLQNVQSNPLQLQQAIYCCKIDKNKKENNHEAQLSYLVSDRHVE